MLLIIIFHGRGRRAGRWRWLATRSQSQEVALDVQGARVLGRRAAR
jgi:hypothetical protein